MTPPLFQCNFLLDLDIFDGSLIWHNEAQVKYDDSDDGKKNILVIMMAMIMLKWW